MRVPGTVYLTPTTNPHFSEQLSKLSPEFLCGAAGLGSGVSIRRGAWVRRRHLRAAGGSDSLGSVRTPLVNGEAEIGLSRCREMLRQNISVVRSDNAQALLRPVSEAGLLMYCTSGVSSNPPKNSQFQ